MVAKEDQAQTKLGVHKAVVVEMEAGVVTEDLAVVLTTVWAAADNRVAVVVCLKWVETAEEASIRTKKKDKGYKNVTETAKETTKYLISIT